MLAAMALAATLADCVPMRWTAAHPLSALDGSPVTCLLIEEPQWTPTLIDAALNKGLRILAVARNPQQAQRAAQLNIDAIVLENTTTTTTTKPTISLATRKDIRFDATAPIIGAIPRAPAIR